MTDPKDMTGLVERLREQCTDWTGEPIVDESTTRTEMSCRDVREAVDAITTLLEEVGRLRSALQAIARHESSVSDMHMECGECHDAYADDCSEMRSAARAALQQGSVDGRPSMTEVDEEQ